MTVPFTIGPVGHFGLAVRDPKRSAKWFVRVLGLRKEFEFEEGVAVGNDHVTIALSKGKPSPKTIGHMSFHLENMTALRKALEHLKKHKVRVEDPGNEIGPESPGSPHMGLWFHDPDDYRWELSVQCGRGTNKKKRSRNVRIHCRRTIIICDEVRRHHEVDSPTSHVILWK